MKKVLAAMCVMVFVAGSYTAYAMPYGDRSEKRMERMTRSLDLSEDQQKQFQELFDAHMERREAMRIEMDNQIKSILNDEQKAKYDDFVQKRKERRSKRKAGKRKNDCFSGQGGRNTPPEPPQG